MIIYTRFLYKMSYQVMLNDKKINVLHVHIRIACFGRKWLILHLLTLYTPLYPIQSTYPCHKPQLLSGAVCVQAHPFTYLLGNMPHKLRLTPQNQFLPPQISLSYTEHQLSRSWPILGSHFINQLQQAVQSIHQTLITLYVPFLKK